MPSDRYFMNLAFEVAKSSKCLRAQYGSVLVSSDDRIISTGYNGKPRNSWNDDVCYRIGLSDNSKELPNCCIHSEINCLLFSDPIARKHGTLYVSGIPCQDCMLTILQSGISRLVYHDGPSASGHKGNFSWDMIENYGFKHKIAITALLPE